jgi:hypothetical protein
MARRPLKHPLKLGGIGYQLRRVALPARPENEWHFFARNFLNGA